MIYTTVVCQRCNTAERLVFEKLEETWSDLLEHLKSVGTEWEGGPRQETVRIIACRACPKAKKRKRVKDDR